MFRPHGTHSSLLLPHRVLAGQSNDLGGSGDRGGPRIQLSSLPHDPQQHAGSRGPRLPAAGLPGPSWGPRVRKSSDVHIRFILAKLKEHGRHQTPYSANHCFISPLMLIKGMLFNFQWYKNGLEGTIKLSCSDFLSSLFQKRWMYVSSFKRVALLWKSKWLNMFLPERRRRAPALLWLADFQRPRRRSRFCIHVSFHSINQVSQFDIINISLRWIICFRFRFILKKFY